MTRRSIPSVCVRIIFFLILAATGAVDDHTTLPPELSRPAPCSPAKK